MNMCLSPGKTTSRSGFSFFESLVVVAMLGIIATLLITYVSPMRETTSIQVARQQQAELQTALGAWIAAASSGPGGLAAARGSYSGAGSKLGLLQAYLQPATYAALSGSGSSVSSEALAEAGASLQFSSWGVDNSPSVNWVGGQ
jgi:prepilin-type N-terminal cleavage/methylation domain-containing protein